MKSCETAYHSDKSALFCTAGGSETNFVDAIQCLKASYIEKGSRVSNLTNVF